MKLVGKIVYSINENLWNQIKSEQKSAGLHIWSDSELNENQILAEQLKYHPMFQDYCTGEICNRLCVKNIAKEADLQAIYNRYLELSCGECGNVRSIDIRLMISSRMKV